MSKDPILVLQMQRMGDLILSFPLLIMLLKKYPGHPVWVAAEEIFFKGLMPIAPEVTFFPSNALPRMYGHKFHMVLNLSHRPEAGALASKVRFDKWVGPLQNEDSSTYIEGPWQLYRASLTHNNRHNNFHWADLNALDVIPYPALKSTVWNPVKIDPGKNGIGLFLGASDQAKRPDAEFWTKFAKSLLKKGLNPVLLGGENERPLGREVASLVGIPKLNLVGRFNIPGLVQFMSSLELLVTPDTGPMHLAAWLGLPVLNLSMGPVNAWDTGPLQPSHLILRSNISCRGCWQCPRELACHRHFSPGRTASLVSSVLKRGLGDEGKGYLSKLSLPCQEIFFSSRKEGLYSLEPLKEGASGSLRNLLGEFWRQFFGTALGLWPEEKMAACWQDIQTGYPCFPPTFDYSLSILTKEYASALKKRSRLAPGFWESVPPLLRPLSGYLQMQLQNGDYSQKSFAHGAGMLDLISSITEA